MKFILCTGIQVCFCDLFNMLRVLVHTGEPYAGHYYSYLNVVDHNAQDTYNWFKFNDDSVTKTNSSEAIQGNFGGHSTTSSACKTR